MRRQGINGGVHFHLAVVAVQDWIFHTYRSSATRVERRDSLAFRFANTLLGRYRHEALCSI